MGFLKNLCRRFSKAYIAFCENNTPNISSFRPNISRNSLKRNCRILFIDDEEVGLVEDLQKEGFAVEQDKKGDDITRIEQGYFDLIILDYKGVGEKYGTDEGLSLLTSIKRVNPSIYVLAYTSQNLNPSKSSAFFNTCDGTLQKDAGVADSIQRIEDALREAVQSERIWNGILKLSNIQPKSKEALELEKKVVDALLKHKKDQAISYFEQSLKGKSELLTSCIEKLAMFAIEKSIGI